MSEYDEVLAEDVNVNRMHESLKLFNTICRIKWFEESPFVLFLNKKDVFDEKIVYSPLNHCFPGYDAGTDKYKASEYISEQFTNENKSKRRLYVHYTCAKDTKSVHVATNELEWSTLYFDTKYVIKILLFSLIKMYLY